MVYSATALLLLASFAVHLLIWKRRRPRHHIPALLLIFGVTLVLALVAGIAFLLIHPGQSEHVSIPQCLHVILFYTSASLAYITAFSGIELDSPTLSLMMFIAKGEAAGVAQEDAALFFAQRPFINTRLAGLLEGGLLREEGDRIYLAGKGSTFFRVILAYRKLYGSIPQGG